ncbi:hypothetical protein GLW08_12895 [Pontibacillus yanchengensis]|uniref:Uncharacterized protein n=2 Tax=Pontibacillus yanchengensis TaxID=462910 RepID=A0ACC7VH25_9BACI|nr:YaaC family protein [Pontibacillus yanchengensis]MYL34423.1 hypothetical protein [Pontibacillus yanchengensis]MYL54231.1 hypothetical protein [Pontibacillus yanchengensis]
MKIHNIQSIYLQLQSAPYAQSYLSHCYKKLQYQDIERKSFENTYRLIYYLEHGQTYYEQGKQAPLAIQPVLFFYGMGQLLKALLISKRPDYPETTSILAHGVTTRKRKKQQYSFLQDEVKIQHKGLFSYLAKHLFHVEQYTTEKYSMNDLLSRLPELNPIYTLSSQKQNHIFMEPLDPLLLQIPEAILDDYNWTFSYFTHSIQKKHHHISQTVQHGNNIHISLERPLDNPNHPYFYYDSYEDKYTLSTNRHHLEPFPEILTHYLILYNLSMICRYETEWWGDQIHSFSSEDLVYIKAFLKLTQQKIPLLIGHALLEQTK